MARKPHNVLSQTPRAIKWRIKKAQEDAAWALENLATNGTGDPVPPQLGLPMPDGESEPIGVFSAPDKPDAPEPVDEAQAYHCLNCQNPVQLGDARCSVCEQLLKWPEGAGE